MSLDLGRTRATVLLVALSLFVTLTSSAGAQEEPPGETADTVAPSNVTLDSGAFDKPFKLFGMFTLRWGAVDDGPGPLVYRLKRERIKPNGVLDAYEVSEETESTSMRVTALPGFTYCFSVAASDQAGNTSESGSRCVTRPLDEEKLEGSGEAWRRTSRTTAYLRTVARSPEKGAVLRRYGVGTTKVALVATTCPRCGQVEVSLGDLELGIVDLRSSSTRRKRLVRVASFSRPTFGTLAIRVVSEDEPVVIEGVGLGNVSRADALSSDPAIGLRPEARADLESGLVDARVLEALIQVSAHHSLRKIGPFSTGHSTFVAGTDRVSLHKFGRAVDLYYVDGSAVDHANWRGRASAIELSLLPAPFRPERLGSPWLIPSNDVISFTRAHGDHIHFSYAPAPILTGAH